MPELFEFVVSLCFALEIPQAPRRAIDGARHKRRVGKLLDQAAIELNRFAVLGQTIAGVGGAKQRFGQPFGIGVLVDNKLIHR